MKRVACARLIKERLSKKDIVVCGLGSVEAAYKEVGPAGPTYFASDPMGIWSSVALGLAHARPDRRVIHLAGDGDLTMNLECLITIAAAAPPNLRIVVFQNGTYASSAGHPIAGADQTSIAGIAKNCGFRWATEAASEEEARDQIDALLKRSELGLVAVRLEAEGPSGATPPGRWAQVEERTLFMLQVDASREEA